ncbi:PX domain-containing protein kinase-like protein [Leptonychotes weddellii]|uniref:PX domain-containing protein kinase-like protein n=1 Tax=Leptonychotes weddellii TaxID=9713 RepID=A0A7F8Q0E2_LEPWE|nr:PX domain-containing protein kinase-like protein [Leptonychotes weddellii]
MEYIIRVQRGISVENSWQIVRRYSDFDLLNNSLQIAGLSLPLPPKKLIGNMDREFIAERQKGLQNYLNVITTNHILSNCELVKKFLDPNNYSANYTEIALQQVSMFFRSEPKWEVVEPLKDIGWRIRKKYFLMKIKNQPKERLVLSWADLGPDKYLSDKDFQCLIKLLPSCLHPYIYRVTFATANESSALLIRMFNDKGTLKDLIYKAKPKDPFLKKYCNPKKIQGLELQQIKTYGRQILEVLKFLHDKGFPYGHLHASNVMLDGDTCRLLDLENSLLGLPSFYRSYFSQFRKINTLESMDVHSFGHLLYEMTYGRPPDSVPVDSFPPAPSMAVVAVLESTLSCEACKNGMPTVSRLLQMPLFSDVLLTTSEKPQFKTLKSNNDLCPLSFSFSLFAVFSRACTILNVNFRDVRFTSSSSASASASTSTTSSSLASCEPRGAYTAPAPGCERCEPRGLTQLHPEFPKGNFEESRNL